jgi:hypothetical protein
MLPENGQLSMMDKMEYNKNWLVSGSCCGEENFKSLNP